MKKFSILLLFLSLSFSACATTPVEIPSTAAVSQLSETRDSPTALPDRSEVISFDGGTYLGLTYQQPDGSRQVDGQGSIEEAKALRVPLGGEAEWLVAVPAREGSLWTAVLGDGRVVNVLVREGSAEVLDLGWGPLPPATPPLVLVYDRQARLVGPPSAEASVLSHPVLLDPASDRLVFIDNSGDLVLMENGAELDRLEARALPDARLLVDERFRVLFLSDPADRYDHGVLGDSLEATSIMLVETDPALKVITRIEIPAPAVVEGIAPLWIDLDGDGGREILVTLSDYDQGARLALFDENGEKLAEGPPAGQAYRWRHQLAALPLNAGPEMAVFDVLRPHLDALLEVYTWRGEYLTVMESIPGYPSHSIGSRNLDQALAGDFDGDGVVELVVPGRDRDTLAGIYYESGALGQAWSIPLGGELRSNLAGVTLPDGSLLLGAGVGEELVVWEQEEGL